LLRHSWKITFVQFPGVTLGDFGRDLGFLLVGPARERIARRSRWRGSLFEGVVVDGSDFGVLRRVGGGVLWEGVADSGRGCGDFGGDLLIDAH
jgi:hypothetical protein